MITDTTFWLDGDDDDDSNPVPITEDIPAELAQDIGESGNHEPFTSDTD